MEEKRGLNFLVGLFGLWMIWKLYNLGVFHRIGFLAINTVAGTDLYFNPNLMLFSSNQDYLVGSTPLAVFAALLIDAVTILGSLLVIVCSGIWDLLLKSSSLFNDLLYTLKSKLQGFKKEISDNTKTSDLPKEDLKEDINYLEVILMEIKDIKKSQTEIEEEFKIIKGEKSE